MVKLKEELQLLSPKIYKNSQFPKVYPSFASSPQFTKFAKFSTVHKVNKNNNTETKYRVENDRNDTKRDPQKAEQAQA